MMDGQRRQRIGIFLPSLVGGGAESVMVTLANEFVTAGYAVDLLLVAANGPHLSRIKPDVHIIELGGRGVMAAIPALARYLRRTPPVALLSAMSHANVAALLAHRLSRSKVRLVVSERMSLAARRDLYDSPGERLLRLLMRILYKRAAAVIAVSIRMGDDLAATLALRRECIHVLPSPLIGPAWLSGTEPEPDASWWPLKDGGPLILSAGRLTAVKDYPLLIRAFARLVKARPARLLILGEGEDRVPLQALIAELDLEHRVSMPGYVPNPGAYMRRADLFVLSSRYEGLPGVLVQALACGVPVVSTDCLTGPREILDGGRWGRLVPTGDEAALAAAMSAALDDADHPDTTACVQAYREDVAAERYLDVLLDRGTAEQF